MVRPPTRRGLRGAMTLTEGVVVLAIIAVLVGLLVPAVQRARGLRPRSACQNNLRQIGVALLEYHHTYGSFPTNGGYGGDRSCDLATQSGCPGSYLWGMGNPGLGTKRQTGSWAYSILRYLGEQSAVDHGATNVAVSAYMCPSRGRDNPQTVMAQDPLWSGWHYTFQGPQGPITSWGKTDYAGNLYLLVNREPRPAAYSLGDITDGPANTLLVGEKAMDPRAYNVGGWYWDEPVFTGGAGGTGRSGAALVRDANGNDFPNNWGSPHLAGAQFVFADGHVQTLAYGTNGGVVQALLTPRSGETGKLDRDDW